MNNPSATNSPAVAVSALVVVVMVVVVVVVVDAHGLREHSHFTAVHQIRHTACGFQ
jgi:hypothetical protein